MSMKSNLVLSNTTAAQEKNEALPQMMFPLTSNWSNIPLMPPCINIYKNPPQRFSVSALCSDGPFCSDLWAVERRYTVEGLVVLMGHRRIQEAQTESAELRQAASGSRGSQTSEDEVK